MNNTGRLTLDLVTFPLFRCYGGDGDGDGGGYLHT